MAAPATGSDPSKRPARPTQEDVLAKKGHALKSGLGLQIWGDPFPEGPTSGDASTGTAERQARLRRGRKPR